MFPPVYHNTSVSGLSVFRCFLISVQYPIFPSLSSVHDSASKLYFDDGWNMMVVSGCVYLSHKA